MTYPEQLPEHPEGWTRNLVFHFNYGEEGGSATYSVKDADGQEMPFIYGYDTRKPGVKGFKLPNNDAILTWAQLREKWPEWVSEQEQAEGPGDIK